MPKRIFVLNGHPAETSQSHQFATAYAQSAEAQGHDLRVVHIRDLDFDPDYGFAGYSQQKPLEPDLEQVLENIRWCDHLVLTTPMWWGGLPAKLKGLIDRVFLPGTAFDPRAGGLPKPLLTGRSARVIMTSDSPWWYFRFWLHRPLYWQLKRQILEFCGLKPTKITHFAPSSHPRAGQVDTRIEAVRKLGARAI